MTSYDDIAVQVLEELLPDWIDAYQESIERAGLTLTEELKQDFRYAIIRGAGVVSAEIDFRQYGRFKDMKQLRFTRVPDIDAIKSYVETVGPQNFAYVPGYDTTQRPPTVNNAIARIAAGVAFGMRNKVNVKRTSKEGWYNTTTTTQLNKGKAILRQKVIVWAASQLKEAGEEG
ncbi:MAG: hypothetical protein ACK41O_14620 [Runella zeae]